MEVDDDVVSRYIHLDSRVKKTEDKINETKKRFYDQTMYTRTGYRDEELVIESFNLEVKVIDYASATQMAEKRLEVLKFKNKYFKRFWSELDVITHNYYRERYINEMPISNGYLDKTIVNEIKQIEEAARHFVGFYEAEKKQIGKMKSGDHLSAMLKLLGV